MRGDRTDQWGFSSWRTFLSKDGLSETEPGQTNRRYFCRTCGTTVETHRSTCPNCGGRMLEPAGNRVARSD